MTRSCKLAVVVFCVLAFQLTGCQKNRPVNTTDVDPIAENILTAIGNGQADKVYDTYFTPEYRKMLSREKWKGMVEVYKKNLGAFKSLKRTMTSATDFEGQVEGSFVFSVTWEKREGKATFNMSLRESWQLVNLQIDANAMSNTNSLETPLLKSPLPIKTGN